MTFLYHLGYIRQRLLLQQACQNPCTKHDTSLMSVCTPLLLGVSPVCRTEWPLLSSVTHMPDIAACPDLETTAQMHLSCNFMEQERDRCLNGVKRVWGRGNPVQKRACPSARYGHFPITQPRATFLPGHDSHATAFPITSMKVPLSPALKRHLLGRGAQTTYTRFLSKTEKSNNRTPFFMPGNFCLH